MGVVQIHLNQNTNR